MKKKKLYIRWETIDGLSMDASYIIPESTLCDLVNKDGVALNDALALISLGFGVNPDVPKSFKARITQTMRFGWSAVSCARNKLGLI